MTKNKYLLGIFASLTLSANAQKENAAEAPAGVYKLFATDQTEFGINLGLAQVHGDFGRGFVPGFGVGVHLRKALDYTWSLRAEAGYEQLNSKNSAGKPLDLATGQPGSGAGFVNAKKVQSTVARGTVQLVASLNNNRWENGLRKLNPYLYMGVGMGKFNTKVDGAEALSGVTESLSPIIETGAGLSFRISDKMNLGLDAKVSSLFGKRMDLIDAYNYRWKDLTSYFSARLNFNLGGGADAKTAKSLPLWWVNPAAKINADVAEIAARPKLDLTDTDGDGIIDMLDQEKDTPAGARVDTRGVSLDSDGDSVPDYKDKEPFSPIGYTVDKSTGVAQVTKPNYITQTEVDKIVADKLKAWETTYKPVSATDVASGKSAGGSVADWFLPMIHFDFGSPAIRQAEIGNLYNVATVMKNNPGIKIVVSGYTDKVSDESSNQKLSYQRAQNSIDYLVKKFGIDRSRLVLNYAGETTTLVDTKAQNLMNRRVEFKVAQSESDMSAPAGASKKKYKGHKAY